MFAFPSSEGISTDNRGFEIKTPLLLLVRLRAFVADFSLRFAFDAWVLTLRETRGPTATRDMCCRGGPTLRERPCAPPLTGDSSASVAEERSCALARVLRIARPIRDFSEVFVFGCASDPSRLEVRVLRDNRRRVAAGGEPTRSCVASMLEADTRDRVDAERLATFGEPRGEAGAAAAERVVLRRRCAAAARAPASSCGESPFER